MHFRACLFFWNELSFTCLRLLFSSISTKECAISISAFTLKMWTPLSIAWLSWRSFCTLIHFFCAFLVGAELNAQRRAGRSVALSPQPLCLWMYVVALMAALGFHLENGLVQFLQSASLGWYSGELCSLGRWFVPISNLAVSELASIFLLCGAAYHYLNSLKQVRCFLYVYTCLVGFWIGESETAAGMS